MGFQPSGNRGGGKRGGRGGSRGGSRGGGFSNRGGNRNSNGGGYHNSGGRSSYGGQKESNDQRYYNQNQQYNDQGYGADSGQQEFGQQPANYDNYYQQDAPPPSAGSYQEQQQPPYDANAQQQYYNYQQTDANGYASVPPSAGEYPPNAGSAVSSGDLVSQQGGPEGSIAVPPSANGPGTGGSSETLGSAAQTAGGVPPEGDGAAAPPPDGEYPVDPMFNAYNQYPGYPLDQSGLWIDKTYHDEVAKKVENLKANYHIVNKKYTDLKEKYKINNENYEKKFKYQAEKIKQLTAQLSKTEKVVVPDGDGDVEVDAENVKYSSKDTVTSGSVVNALKEERNVYKKRNEELAVEIKKVKADQQRALDTSSEFEQQLAEVKEKYLLLENEKTQLESKLELIEQSPPKSPIYDDTTEGDLGDAKDLKSLTERKEYYKNKYLQLLEEKNAEQQSFLQVNKKLLEQFIFTKTDTKTG